mmetsp:Transcript_20236/g.43830  ORF Transcript_20236/g.43830 Transcript_20236/m.43830 type:complete len:204 (+) Transcript_20236:594-1205(+)
MVSTRWPDDLHADGKTVAVQTHGNLQQAERKDKMEKREEGEVWREDKEGGRRERRENGEEWRGDQDATFVAGKPRALKIPVKTKSKGLERGCRCGCAVVGNVGRIKTAPSGMDRRCNSNARSWSRWAISLLRIQFGIGAIISRRASATAAVVWLDLDKLRRSNSNPGSGGLSLPAPMRTWKGMTSGLLNVADQSIKAFLKPSR